MNSPRNLIGVGVPKPPTATAISLAFPTRDENDRFDNSVLHDVWKYYSLLMIEAVHMD